LRPERPAVGGQCMRHRRPASIARRIDLPGAQGYRRPRDACQT
jgi:hypothetical protein